MTAAAVPIVPTDRDRAARWGVHRGAMADHRTSRARARPRERGARRLGRPLVRAPTSTGRSRRCGTGWARTGRSTGDARPSPRRPPGSRPRRNASPGSSPRRAARPSSRPSARSARAVETLRLSGECADALTGETLPLDNTERGAGRIGWFVRAPVGIVAAITPFNDPLNLVAHKLGPALLAGNGVILKPHEATSLTALAFAGVLLEAGVPGDRLAVVCGEAETGGHVVTHPQVDVVSFTGGPRTAARISAMAGPRRLLMELGGNNPTLVCADADPTAAAAAIVAGAFGAAGQNCLSVQRVYIARELFDLVSAAVVAKTRALVVGQQAEQAHAGRSDDQRERGPPGRGVGGRRRRSWRAGAGRRHEERQLPHPDRARQRSGRRPDRGRGGVRAGRLPLRLRHGRGRDREGELGAGAARGGFHAGRRHGAADQRTAGRGSGPGQRHQRLPHRCDAVRGLWPLRHRQGRHQARDRGDDGTEVLHRQQHLGTTTSQNAIRRHNEVDPKDPDCGAGRDRCNGPGGLWKRKRRHRDAGGLGVEPDR